MIYFKENKKSITEKIKYTIGHYHIVQDVKYD